MITGTAFARKAPSHGTVSSSTNPPGVCAVPRRGHLPRRTFLRGLGTAVALPFLDAMTPAFASASKPITRVAFIYTANGVIMSDWTPAETGAGFSFTKTLHSLEPFRDRLLVLTGLAHRNGEALGDGPGDHARAGASWLTGVHPRKTQGADIRNGMSVDQMLAEDIGRSTPLPSLELGLQDVRMVGGCDSGYSCAYSNTVSWSSPTTPLPYETNPRRVFERLFGDGDTTDPAVRAVRARQNRSLLDFVREDAGRLRAGLGAGDRRKLGDYLDSVREVERRIQNAERRDDVDLPALARPDGVPPTFEEHVRTMSDLIAIAFQADLTRVVTLMYSREGGNRTYRSIGVPGRAPRPVAPPERPRAHGAAAAHRPAPRRDVRLPPRKAPRRRRRQRVAARPLDGPLRQQPQRLERPHPRRPAGGARRWRQRHPPRRAPPALPRPDADDEPVRDHARQAGLAPRAGRRQHRAHRAPERAVIGGRGGRAALAAAALAGGTLTAAAGESRGVAPDDPSVLVLVPSAADDRLASAHEAIAFWNDRLAELGVETRFAEPRVVVESPVERAVENYARQVAQRATRLPAGDAEPPPPAALVDLDADVVLLLSRQDILSFAWPLPRVSPPRYLVVIRRVRGPYRTDPMVTKHVVAHELGHALGLDHNAEPHTLMCGPCQPLTAEPDATGFLPLTAGDRARLVELHGG